jgi:hypothetical protein
MLKIKKITIENFRGIRLPIVLDFVKGSNLTSAVIYGLNGTGKSSIVDAWEWFNNFEILFLSREGVSYVDFPHKASGGNDSYIAVDFQHPTIKTIKAKFNNKKIATPIITGEYDQLKTLSTYPNFLRYSDLQDFVYKRKAERYKYIAKFFGLEQFSLLQDTLQTAINKQKLNLQNHQTDLDRNISAINSITGLITVDENTVVKFINSIGIKHKIAPIIHFKDANTVKSALEKIVRTNPVAKELSEWKAFQVKQNQFYPIPTLKVNCITLENHFTDLKKDEENIKQLILSSLYELSIEIIPKLEDKNKCPVCDNEFEGDLLKHVFDKHASLKALNKKKTEFDNKKAALEKQIENLTRKIVAILSENSTVVLITLQSFFNDLDAINNALPTINTIVKKQLKDLENIEISTNPVIEKIEGIITNERANKKIVMDKIEALSNDEKTKTLAQDYNNISNIIDGFKSYSVNKEKVAYLIDINENLSFFFSQLTAFIQTTIQSTFTKISADVVDYFNVLECSNPFIKNPELKLITDKDKAVELEIEFVSEKITPAFKFLSESQVNSFGLAIFLAAVKHFNNKFKFFILDDVVGSFDCFKRPRVSQLIATRFSDFQVLMITHDQIFFETIQRDFPNWQRYKFISWDYTTGPKLRLAKNYSEEIREYLDDDKPITAGQRLGRYLEWTFGVLNENLQTPIKYKIENTYTLSEFYEPLIKRFKDKLKQTGKQHRLIQSFDNLEQGTIFRNYCAHWKNEANPFTSSEIETIFNKWLDIEKMLYCESCKSFAKYDASTGTEYVKCNCGALDLKVDSNYI